MFDKDKIKYYHFPSILNISSSHLHITHIYLIKWKILTYLDLSLLLFFENIEYKKLNIIKFFNYILLIFIIILNFI